MLKAGQRCRIIIVSRSNQFARLSNGERYEKMVEERNKGSGIYERLCRSIMVPGFSVTFRLRSLAQFSTFSISTRIFPLRPGPSNPVKDIHSKRKILNLHHLQLILIVIQVLILDRVENVQSSGNLFIFIFS